MAPHPIQNSEVYVLNGYHNRPISAAPPPSPPTPCELEQLSPVPDDVLPLTPTDVSSRIQQASTEERLAYATHVLNTEATALSCLATLYASDATARDGFSRAIQVITSSIRNRGKLVICGVGKSGHIGKKLVATMNSLQITSIFLHPTEALHGDLGGVSDHDVILLITFSGRTPELLQLVPHFNSTLPVIIMTSHTHPSTCEITKQWPKTVLLPAPIHESETVSFGVNAPTTSTTVSLALGDALAVVISAELHPSVAEVFSRNHPGGAIGAAFRSSSKKLSDLATPFCVIPTVELCDDKPTRASEVLLAGYHSKSGWVAFGEHGVASPQRIRRIGADDMLRTTTDIPGLIVPADEWIRIASDTDLAKAVDWLKMMRDTDPHGRFDDDAVVATVVDGAAVGLMELSSILEAA